MDPSPVRLDQGDDGERADDEHRVQQQVQQHRRHPLPGDGCPARCDAASTPTSMNPAWLIDEYASIRLTSVWTTAIIAPTSSVSTASTQITGR